MTQVISGARLFTGETFLDNHSLVITDGLIEAIVADSQIDQGIPCQQLDGGILAPGFIDIQVNGGGDVLLNNEPTLSGLTSMVNAHRSYGTTGIMATLVSDTQERITAGVDVVKQAVADQLPGVLGVHIEGPFLNTDRRGAHKRACIRQPDEADIDWLCGLSPLKTILTLAPEQTSSGQIKALANAGILVCVGHTNAQSDKVIDALQQGACGFTHLFNAMSTLTAREPGVVGVALESTESWCGIIADGYHVDPINIRLAVAAKPCGKMLLISDAMATVGGNKKSFTLYDETIFERDGKLINAEGKLAGSAIGMIDAVRFMTEQVGISLSENLRMASLYPAQFLQLDANLGRLQKGYQANLVHFNEQHWQVLNTWIHGIAQSH